MGHFLNNHIKITNANILCNSDSFVTIESITNIIYYNIFTFKIRGKFHKIWRKYSKNRLSVGIFNLHFCFKTKAVDSLGTVKAQPIIVLIIMICKRGISSQLLVCTLPQATHNEY